MLEYKTVFKIRDRELTIGTSDASKARQEKQARITKFRQSHSSEKQKKNADYHYACVLKKQYSFDQNSNLHAILIAFGTRKKHYEILKELRGPDRETSIEVAAHMMIYWKQNQKRKQECYYL